MARRWLRRSEVTEAEARAKWARDGWAAHEKLCWQCHAAGGRPGLLCDEGFTLAQNLSRARLAAARARQRPGQAQGTLL